MQALYNIVLVAGSRPKGVKQFGSEAENKHFNDCWTWLKDALGYKITRELKAIGTVVAKLDIAEAEKLEQDPRILSIEKVTTMQPAFIQDNAYWALANICGRSDSRYNYENTGLGVSVYVVDSGIDLAHPEFEGRAVRQFDVASHIPIYSSHGTHVAGSVGSKTYGVAKQAKLIDIRVLTSDATPADYVTEGLLWIIENHPAGTPGVVNMSMGGGMDIGLEMAVAALVVDGLTVVAAAGNNGVDVGNTSPARMSEVITVGATDITNALARTSNFGLAVDILAPGVNITSTLPDGAIGDLSGTSMACPIVAGVIACYLEDNLAAPDKVKLELKRQAQLNKSTHTVANTTKDIVRSLMTRVWYGTSGVIVGLSPFKKYTLKPFTLSGETRSYSTEVEILQLARAAVVNKFGLRVDTQYGVVHLAPNMMPGINPEPGV